MHDSDTLFFPVQRFPAFPFSKRGRLFFFLDIVKMEEAVLELAYSLSVVEFVDGSGPAY